MKNLGDNVKLAHQEVEVVECENCKHLMVNLDANELQVGDLAKLKSEGVRISNPDTENHYCLNCEYKTFGKKVADFFENDDDDDSSFFSSSSGRSTFGGFGSGGGFGGFGGFGGGGFGGGGASRGF
jgi:uncharacterized membrane protein YgcG